MQPQQPVGGAKQPIKPQPAKLQSAAKPTSSKNPFIAQRPATPAASAMPAMQPAARPSVANGPVADGQMLGGRPAAALAAPAAPAPAAPVQTPIAAISTDISLVEEPLEGINVEEKTSSDSVAFSNGSAGANKSRTMLIAMIGCGVLALAGVVFGVLGMMKKPDTRVEYKKEILVDKAAAENIARPYFNESSPYNTILDAGMTDAAKLALAFYNLSFRGVYGPNEAGSYVVDFATMNDKYRALFGTDIPNFETINDLMAGSFAYQVNDSGVGQIVVTPITAGGTGFVSVVRVKDAAYGDEEDTLNVEVYRDIVPVCGLAEETVYCLGPDIINDAVVDEYVENYSDTFPIVTMKFTSTDNGYVLTGIEKEEVEEEEEVEVEVEEEVDLIEI